MRVTMLNLSIRRLVTAFARFDVAGKWPRLIYITHHWPISYCRSAHFGLIRRFYSWLETKITFINLSSHWLCVCASDQVWFTPCLLEVNETFSLAQTHTRAHIHGHTFINKWREINIIHKCYGCEIDTFGESAQCALKHTHTEQFYMIWHDTHQ